ncbi:MAG TPA: efflux RND transporter periplasmic adaptor subunit [Rhizomicrobium sp.]|nr:efflux RND transporter periplasmic adaptor subunit [Rhizomicrobium sp.]
MNVQMNPIKTPPTRDRGDAPSGINRTYVIGGAALALALGGFWYFTHNAAPPPRRMTAAPVKVAVVEQRNMAVIERTIGTVMANSTVAVNARVTGQLTRAFFKEGQMVKTGDLLFQIDPRPYQATYDNATAAMASAKAKFDRYTRLKSQNAISPQDVDDAQASYLENRATAESARLNLEFTQIRSPVNGKTGPILIQPGNMVASSSSANASTTPLVTINEIQPVKISFSLPQSDLPRIQEMARTKGLTITMNMRDAGGGDNLTAKVDFISNAVTGNTGTIELRATYPNADMALVPGQLVDVVVALSEIPNATVVPREAVNTGPDGQFVYLVKNGTAQQVPVRVLFDDTVNDAVQGDLKAGDRVITDGQLRVIPGAKVNVTGTKKAASSKARITSGGRRAPLAKDRDG